VAVTSVAAPPSAIPVSTPVAAASAATDTELTITASTAAGGAVADKGGTWSGSAISVAAAETDTLGRGVGALPPTSSSPSSPSVATSSVLMGATAAVGVAGGTSGSTAVAVSSSTSAAAATGEAKPAYASGGNPLLVLVPRMDAGGSVSVCV
jgi:hypothetical protein